MSLSKDEHRKMMKERGAIEVIDGQGGGFDQFEQEFHNPALDDPKLQKELEEIESKQHDIKSPQAHLELLQQVIEENMNLEAVREAQWLNQDEITDFVPGRMMTHVQFLKLLKKIRPDAHYNEDVILGRLGLNVINPLRLNAYFVTSVQFGLMVEWSQMRVDEHNIPTNEKYRGWRTVLMTLIEKEIISIEDCDRIFGKPTGPRADRWYRMLFILRNSRCPDCLNYHCSCKTFGDSLRSDNYAYGH